MKQNENGKKIKENIRNQMRRIGSWKSWSKRRKLTTGVCGVCVIAVVAGAIGLSGGSDTEVIYKETTVKYGTLVKGVTETGSVDIGTVDQTFDLDMSALQRTDTSGISSSGGSSGSTAGSSSGSGGFGGMSASGGGAQGGLDMFGQIFNMGGSSSGSNGDDSTLTVAEVVVSVGQQVSEGDPLYLLEEDSVSDLEDELQSNVEKAKADLEAVEADQTLSKQQAKYTYDSSTAYGSYIDTEYSTTLQELQNTVDSAESTLEQAKSSLEDYRAQLEEVTAAYEDAAQVLSNCKYSLNSTDAADDTYGYVYYAQLTEQAQSTADSLEQQKEELEQQKKDKALLDSAELELQKAETKKTEGLRKKKELEGLIALVKEFQGAYNATKEQQEKYKISIEKVQKQREVYQKLFQSFLDAQAGLLAQELKEGCPCPVCGSFEHPRPGILPKGQVVDQEILDREKQKLDRLENDANTQSVEAGKRKERQKTLWHQIQREAQELLHETEWKKLIPLLKEKQDQCEKQLADSEEEIRIAIERKKKKNETETWIEKLETEIVQLQEEKNQCDRKQAGLQTRDVENKKQQQITAEEIRKLIQKSLVAGNGEVTDNTAAGFERQIQDMLSCLSEKVQGKEKEAKQKQDLEKLIIEREKTLKELGRVINEAAQDIVRLETERKNKAQKVDELNEEIGEGGKESLEQEIKTQRKLYEELKESSRRAQQKLQEIRAEKERITAVVKNFEEQKKEIGEVDEDALREQYSRFREEKTQLSEKRKALFSVQKGNEEIYHKVQVRQTEMTAAEKEYVWMKNLSDTANGKLNGKAKIELETYIQMAYFDRILRRANLRLMTMSSGQYELKRQEQSKNQKEKAGLDLNVIDHYNGTERSVKTLSGGESFQASLSLALGLSDEIQACAGGIRLDSMFVDEGFGSLDEESLEQALKALTSLADGKRLVGIISHVSELKERIENKIIVTKKCGGDGVGSSIKIQ